MMWFLVSLSAVTWSPVERALDACQYGQGADPWAVQQLLEIEEQAGNVTGILPATWCVEASMRTPEKLRGDHGEAHGPMQLHGWLRNICRGMDVDDLLQAARCYMERIVAMEPKAREKCPNTWMVVAENVTANWPRYGWRCDVKSEHWRALQ